MKWNIDNETPIATHQDLLQHLMPNQTKEELQEYLAPTSPMDISIQEFGINQSELEKAVGRIEQAIENQENVLIYGDYDADGISAVSIIWLILRQRGLTAQPFIPDRNKHGYGLSKKALEEILQKSEQEKSGKIDLVITVDNGITAHEPLKWLQSQDVEVIVTDHHLPPKEKPPTTALVYSTQICGAAVAWVIARELDQDSSKDFTLQLLDIVALATVADQMSLLRANRSFVKYGLERFQTNPRVGLLELMKVAGVDQTKISSGSIGFMLAPRINAVGRLADGIKAVRLLCTKSPSLAKKISRELNEVNQERQSLTTDQLMVAKNVVSQHQQHKLLFVSSAEFHEGIIGLISGRLTEQYFKPSIVVASENEVVKASARSISGINITDLIRRVEDDLLSVGGHELAAGFSADRSKLSEIRQKLLTIADKEISDDLLQPYLSISGILDQSMYSLKTVEVLKKLKPFGLGNREPVFALYDVFLVRVMQIGADNRHLKLLLRLKKDQYHTIQAVWWRNGGKYEQLTNVKKVNIAFCLEANHWNGKTSLQFRVKDIKVAEE